MAQDPDDRHDEGRMSRRALLTAMGGGAGAVNISTQGRGAGSGP
jgi:hypothetical protein